MSLRRPRPCARYGLRENAPLALIGRASRALAAAAARRREIFYGVAIGAIWIGAMTADYNEQAAAERDAALRARAAAEASALEMARWHRENWARATIEGTPARVAEIAGQVANAVVLP